MNKPLLFGRDLLTWIAPLVVLALGVFLFNLPLLLSLVLAVLVFAGLFFILNPKTSTEETQDQVQDEIDSKIKDTRAKVAHIRDLANGIQKQDVRAHVFKICDLADSTLNDMNEQRYRWPQRRDSIPRSPRPTRSCSSTFSSSLVR